LFACFTFKIYALTDVLIQIFDFECCIIYCVLSIYMCYVLNFLIIDLIQTTFISINTIIWLFQTNTININIDITIYIITLIILTTTIQYAKTIIIIYLLDTITYFEK